jgi:Uma2 family endonuclease
MEDDNLIVEEPISEYGNLDVNKSYTYLDYLKWQFEERVELIKGRIFKMSPAPNRRHQTLLSNIHIAFDTVFSKHPCNYYFAPFDVRLPIPNKKKPNTVVQPDFCVICDDSKLDDAGCIGAPDLIVEILSPSNQKHDLATKFSLYEEVGVKEYWVVFPNERMVVVYTLVNGKYVGSKPFIDQEEPINSSLFPDLKIELKEVFRGVD